MLSLIFNRLPKKSPITVIERGMMERVLHPEQLNKWFNKIAAIKRAKDIFF